IVAPPPQVDGELPEEGAHADGTTTPSQLPDSIPKPLDHLLRDPGDELTIAAEPQLEAQEADALSKGDDTGLVRMDAQPQLPLDDLRGSPQCLPCHTGRPGHE